VRKAMVPLAPITSPAPSMTSAGARRLPAGIRSTPPPAMPGPRGRMITAV
jgi:hypothetical protein